MTEVLESWNDFNVAMVGATAALAGLLIVAASVNIKDIITQSSLTARLASAVATLVLALAVCAGGLMPGVSLQAYGILVVVATLVAGAFPVRGSRGILGDRVPENRMRPLKVAFQFLPVLAYLVGGVLAAAGSSAGLYAMALGSLVAVVVALVVSWVVLVEILR